MPETGRPALNFLQRFGVHALLVGAGLAVVAFAIFPPRRFVREDDPAGEPLVAADVTSAELLPPTEEEEAAAAANGGDDGYVRSPLVPQTPAIEIPSEPSGSTADLPELGEREAPAVDEVDPLFVDYTVEEGRHDLRPGGCVRSHRADDPRQQQRHRRPTALSIGQRLTIPTRDGVLHTVQLGQNLDQIATLFEAEAADIVNFAGNDLRSAEDLADGQVILVVGGTFPEPAEYLPVAGDLGPLVIPDWGNLAGIPQTISQAGFILPYWPCARPSAIQDFGYARGRLHAGVDMPSFCARSSNVYAAQSGMVTLANWNGGYGQLVVIDHSYGFSSYYAHLSRMT